MGDTEFAKAQLRAHLGSKLVVPISEGFWSIYTSAKELSERNQQLDQVLRVFQNMLAKVPEWSDKTLSTEVERIMKVSKCPYLDDLVTGVFISYLKSLTTLHYKGPAQTLNLNFERPEVAKFIHEMYIQTSRKLWQTAYLFKTYGVSPEQQAKNRKEVESIIDATLDDVIRSFLPWESITKTYTVDDAPAPPAAPEPEQKEEVPQLTTPPKTVLFDELDSDDGESSVAESELEERPRLQFSEGEEVALDGVEEEEQEEEEIDPMKELEAKVGETLVLNV